MLYIYRTGFYHTLNTPNLKRIGFLLGLVKIHVWTSKHTKLILLLLPWLLYNSTRLRIVLVRVHACIVYSV